MKKSVFNAIIVVSVFTILASSCQKETLSVDPPIENAPVDIYMAGNAGNATYWKNGQVVSLASEPGYESGATSIAIDGNDVYVAGWQGDGFVYGQNIAKYWKNGQEVLLTGPTGAQANSIVVAEGDVYVAGWEFSGNKTVAKYWKNGEAVNLTDGKYNAEATGMVVVNDNVYVCGHENYVAKYWKNGQPVTLSHPGATYAFANSITVVGSDIYVAGSESEGRSRAKYWKNGEEVTLIDGTTKNAIASSIVVIGNDVFVAGWAGDNVGLVGGSGSVAMYWKNGQRVELTNGTNYAQATGIAFFGGDIYISGNLYDYNTTPHVVATYWKNGPDMSTSFDGSSQVVSILVVPQ